MTSACVCVCVLYVSDVCVCLTLHRIMLFDHLLLGQQEAGQTGGAQTEAANHGMPPQHSCNTQRVM